MSFYPIQCQNFSLSGSGCSIGDTVINLKSFQDISGTDITMADLGSIAYMTLEPGNGTQEEQISFTGVTQNADGSAQLTGVKNVAFKTPYTATSGVLVTHPGSVVAILTNTSGYYSQFGILADDETITGNWQVATSTPISSGSLTSKDWVLSVVNGGTVTTDQVVVSGTAGENITAGNILYLKSDGSWYKASSATAATCLNVQLGICQGTVLSGASCSVLVAGIDRLQSGLTAGVTYYLSTAGGLSSSAGTISLSIGEAITTTTLQFKPGFTTGNASASTTGRASTVPITATGSSTLDISWIPTKFSGTGADGALSISSGTTTINLGGASRVVKNYTSISITGTGQLAFSNPHANGTVIVFKNQGATTITSSTSPAIDLRSLGGSGGAGGGNGINGTIGNYGVGNPVVSGAGARGTESGTSSAGGAGGSSLATANAVAGLVIPIATGGGGGGGGGGSASGGGGGGGLGSVGTAGGAAAGAAGNAGGAGGRGAGALLIQCGGAYSCSSVINAAGAAGTNGGGTGAGGGGGGGGGTIIVLYESLTSNTGTYTVSGGAGGTSASGGAGGAGGDGYSLVAANTEFL